MKKYTLMVCVATSYTVCQIIGIIQEWGLSFLKAGLQIGCCSFFISNTVYAFVKYVWSQIISYAIK